MKVTEQVPALMPTSARASGVTEAKDDSSAPQDRVSVSESSVPSGAVEAARASVAANRSARVQEIITAVKSGQYYPSPQQIAQQLVSAAEVAAQLRALLSRG